MSSDPDGQFHGERVLWVGSPARFPRVERLGKVLLVAGILYLGAMLALTVVLVSGGNPAGWLLGLMAVCLLGAAVAGFVQWRIGMRSARYLVTDKRIVITSRWFGQDKVQTAELGSLPPPVVVSTDGSAIGTIYFGGHRQRTRVAAALREIADAQQVRDIVAAAQSGLA